jgi:glycosyltransferase involved in cell wall biosynthesis
MQEQGALPNLITKSAADVLLSAGNFALRRSPVPQILLSRNALYTSTDFLNDLRSRRDYGLWLDTRVKGTFARRSITWADRTVAPSEAFAGELRQWTGAEIRSIHHGFDRQTFFSDGSQLPATIQSKLDRTKDCVRLLSVSHYNYYRNFETILRALPLLAGRPVRLLLTCDLKGNPGGYETCRTAMLVEELGIRDQVVELGPVPHHALHHLYGACEAYVSAAYAESFAHPLVEAMASGLPVVASDIAVHREICGDASLFFNRFSAPELAQQVTRVVESPGRIEEMREKGRRRSQDFSWSRHVDAILSLAQELKHSDSRAARRAA